MLEMKYFFTLASCLLHVHLIHSPQNKTSLFLKLRFTCQVFTNVKQTDALSYLLWNEAKYNEQATTINAQRWRRNPGI